MMEYQELFAKLWSQYTAITPQAKRIHHLLLEQGETIINDHIAIRTTSHPKIDIDVLAKPFLQCGYKEMDPYEFKVKKLFAKYYLHPDPSAPKIFISQLKLEEFSPVLQATMNDCVSQLPAIAEDELLLSGVSWQPKHTVYKDLLSESEYAAWLYAYGFCANHFTINVNQLKKFKELCELNTFLKEQGFKLNTSGGEIKGTPDDYLEQSSTLADQHTVKFSDGEFEVPSCYYEFAKRYPMPDGKLYQGFVAASADKIFESTDARKS